LYFTFGNITSAGNALLTITSTAPCASGDTVLHGNYNINNFGGGQLFNLITSTSPTFDSYTITVRATGVTIQASALVLTIPNFFDYIIITIKIIFNKFHNSNYYY
jgi:hypothetical protein